MLVITLGVVTKAYLPGAHSPAEGTVVSILHYDMCFPFFYSKDVQKTGSKEKVETVYPWRKDCLRLSKSSERGKDTLGNSRCYLQPRRF